MAWSTVKKKKQYAQDLSHNDLWIRANATLSALQNLYLKYRIALRTPLIRFPIANSFWYSYFDFLYILQGEENLSESKIELRLLMQKYRSCDIVRYCCCSLGYGKDISICKSYLKSDDRWIVWITIDDCLRYSSLNSSILKKKSFQKPLGSISYIIITDEYLYLSCHAI